MKESSRLGELPEGGATVCRGKKQRHRGVVELVKKGYSRLL
jgi:hypothetical protein